MKNEGRIFFSVLIIIIHGGCALQKEVPTMIIPIATSSSSQINTVNLPSITTTINTESTMTPTYNLPDLPTQTETMISVPTLPVEEARSTLLSLLANNGNCRLPCLWGIIPGASSSEDAVKSLFPLSSISRTFLMRIDSGTIYPRITEGNLIIVANVSYGSEEDKITKLQFDANVRNQEGNYIFDSDSYGKKLTFYSLFHILGEYGEPSSVLLRTNGGLSPNGELGAFYFILLYPKQGIIVNYFTVMKISGTNALGCPNNAQIFMDLFPSDDIISFNENLTKYWGEKLLSYKRLEDVTSMTIEMFYQTFHNSTTQCVVTPLKYWPTVTI